MPCFFCGKRVSLVRQLTDADFCSDDHRKRYQELTRLALDRLLDAGQRLETPVLHPDAGALPEWQPEAIAVDEPRYEEAIQPVPERRPPPQPEPEEFRRPWRPPEPEPVYAAPAVEQGEPIPPEAFYFARLDCEPQPQAFPPHAVDIETFEPSFNAPTTTASPGRCGLRQSSLLPEPMRRAMSRAMPARSGPGGGEGIHGAPQFGGLAPAAGRAFSICQLTPQPLLNFGPRPARMQAGVLAATEGAGRALPRPGLPRLRGAQGQVAGVRPAALAHSAMPRGTGNVARQPGEIGFLPFQASARVGWPTRLAPGRAVRLSGHRPLSASAVNVATHRSVAPAAVFQAVPSYSCHTALRKRAAVVRAELAGVPLPRAVQSALRQREAPAAVFAGTAILPAFSRGPVARIDIATPPVATERPTEAPRARTITTARRWEPIADFAAVPPAALPHLAATKPIFGVNAAHFEALGRAAVAKPQAGSLARAAAVDAGRWAEPRAGLPVFAPRRRGGSLPAARSLVASGLPNPVRRSASAATPGPAAAFSASASEPITPPSAAIAAARELLDPATYAATSASVPARGTRRGAVTVGAQFGRPEALVQIPTLAARARATHIGAGQPRMGPTPQRPVSVAFRPHTAGSVEFHLQARTPACPIHFEERIAQATHFPAPYPATQKGSLVSAGATLGFAGLRASLPGFRAPAATILLASADAATHLPAARTGRLGGATVPGEFASQGSSEVRLPDVALKLPASSGAIGLRPLQGTAQPAPRVRSAAPSALPALQIDGRALFPAPPAPVSSTHLLPAGTGLALGPRRAAAARAAVKAADFSLPVPPATVMEWTSRTVAPRVLSVATATRGQIASARIRSTAQPCGWLVLGPSDPAIGRASGLLRRGTLRSGSIERGSHLEATPKRPAAAAALGAASPFSAHEASFPREREIGAREAVEIAAAATVVPHFRTRSAAAVRSMGIGFRQRHALLPEILLDATLARIAAARRLDECPTNPLPRPARRDTFKPSAAETENVPIELTAPLSTADSRVRPVGPFPLGAAELAPLPERKAWALHSSRRDAEMVAFEISAPLEPASRGVAGRHTLDIALPTAGKGRSLAGAPRPAAESVAAVSTQPVELAGAQALAFAHPLPPSSFSVVAIRGCNRHGKPVPAGWEAYGRESAVVELESIQSRASGVRWPSATSFQFAHEPEWPGRVGRAAKADPCVSAEFGVPAARAPELAGYEPVLGGAPPARIAAPAAHQDAATNQATVRLEPLVRPHRHPSRLPVFHDTVEKAHMPAGVFHYVEFEDWDDERTMTAGAPYPASRLEPWIPSLAFAPHARYELDEPQLGPVGAGPRPGVETPAGGHGELPFAIEIIVLGSGAQLDKMDFESIAETYEPRWRSALKSASGLFRGVLMVLCVAALGTSLTGCSGRSKSLKENIQSRAAVHMEYDFSKGLEGWYGGDNWAASWSANTSGSVGAGQLALYRPSQQLSDYHFEFLGQINGRSIGWVFRAADPQNYYATQLTITRAGTVPEVSLVRYQVVGGQESERVQIPVHVGLQEGRPYRIQEDVAGSAFTTSVEGEVVDSWTDDRLRAGAVGFFGSPQDKPSLYWIKVSNNDDFWGKVCGILAPSN